MLEAHGQVSEHYEAELDTKPMTVDEYALFYAKELGQEDSYLEKAETEETIQRIRRPLTTYESEIPNQPLHEEGLTIYATQHHAPPVRVVTYSTTQGPNKKIAQTTTDGEPFSIDSEKELNDFMNSESIDGVPAALDAEIRSVLDTFHYRKRSQDGYH